MQTELTYPDGPTAETFIRGLYETLLERSPQDQELSHWVDIARHRLDAATIFQRFLQSAEYRARKSLRPTFPSGHYYSPIVDPAEARRYVSRDVAAEAIPGIGLSLAGMETVWRRMRPFVDAIRFTDEPDPARRYYYRNATFEDADGITLFGLIGLNRPRRIIEIGSGFSSACILDALDHFGLTETALTCIEPDTARLRSVLRPADLSRITLHEDAVQAVRTETFTTLAAGDILFIDSTHVLKTGSDVHRELFSILPNLAPGVLVHFHDIHYPFEYPDRWIFEEKLSWNEIYAIRAFLMYNSRFEILFWGNCLARENPGLFERTCPRFLMNSGGSLWLRVL